MQSKAIVSSLLVILNDVDFVRAGNKFTNLIENQFLMNISKIQYKLF